MYRVNEFSGQGKAREIHGMLSQGLGVLPSRLCFGVPSWLGFPFTANTGWETAHRARLLAKLREPARGAYVFRIPVDVGSGGDAEKKEGEGGREETPPAAAIQNVEEHARPGRRRSQPARPTQPASQPASQLSPPCPHCQVMDAEQKGKQQEQGKALRLRFAVKGRQPRACGWAEPEEGCKGAGPAQGQPGWGTPRPALPR